MVMAVLHPTGGVGPVGSAELSQPDSIAASPTHTGIRINIRNAPLLEDDSAECRCRQRLTARSMKSTSSRDTLVSGVPTDNSCDE